MWAEVVRGGENGGEKQEKGFIGVHGSAWWLRWWCAQSAMGDLGLILVKRSVEKEMANSLQ